MAAPTNTSRFGALPLSLLLTLTDAYELPPRLWRERWTTTVIHAYELPQEFFM